MSDIQIESEDLYEFEINDNVSLFFNKSEECWYLENFDPSISEDNIYIIEDKEFSFVGEIEAFGVVISDDMLEEFKEVVENDI